MFFARNPRAGLLIRALATPLALAAMLPATSAMATPVEVTRFHTADTLAKLDRSPVTLVSTPGTPDGLEQQVWRDAVQRALVAAGFPVNVEAANTSGANPIGKIAEVRVERRTWKPERQKERVSVGVGGSTGSYGSGVGLGIGINLGGGAREMTATTLSVTIRDRASGQSLWEGRAEQTVKASSKEAGTDRASEKLAKALFTDFPGKSGETISVK